VGALPGLGPPTHVFKGDPFRAVYEIKPQKLRDFAREVARKVRPLGEDSVQVMAIRTASSAVRRSRRLHLADRECVEAGADVVIVCFDGASYWQARERLHELGAAVITLEHGTTNCPAWRASASTSPRSFRRSGSSTSPSTYVRGRYGPSSVPCGECRRRATPPRSYGSVAPSRRGGRDIRPRVREVSARNVG